MTHLHDPLVVINDNGVIEVRCSCGRMKTATGAKQACVSVWDSHLALERVSRRDAGSLNLLLNAILDPADGPATWRDLTEFPADIAEKIRRARAEAARRHPAPSPQWLWGVPPDVEEALAAREGTGAPDQPRTAGTIGSDRPRPRRGQVGMGIERYEMATPAREAFIAAHLEGNRDGHGRLNGAQKLLMEHTIMMAAGSVELDIFASVRLRQEFARVIGADFAKLDRSERWMARLLINNAAARWRFRKTVEICIAQDTMFRVPVSWQEALDAHQD